MKIVHINLARGFRGGERQTVLLIAALAQRHNITQTLVCRKDSPLREALADTTGLDFVTATHQAAGHDAVGDADIVHAHEARAVHWAFLHRLIKGSPYLITRRVDVPVKNRLLNRLCYRHATAIAAVSKKIQHSLMKRGWGEVYWVPDALANLSPNDAATREFRNRFPGRFIVGHAGALVDRVKGQRVLLEAARRLEADYPTLHFVFFGQGEDEAALHAESTGQSNVTWMGFKDNIGDYLAGLDAFAFPSHNEGLGSVLLDVMDLGVPIVAAEVGGIPDIVSHENTGLLVPSGNSAALAAALARIYDDAPLRQRLVIQARERLDSYTQEAMADAYLERYKQACSRGAGR